MRTSPNSYHRVFLKLRPVLIPILFFFSPLNSKGLIDSSSQQGIQGKVIAQIPFKISSGLIMIPVRINDSKELRMYLDTGMSGAVVVLFHKELIEEVGLKQTQKAILGGAGGENRKMGTLARGAHVKMAGLEMTDQAVIVMDDSRETSEWQVDGIIGKTLFDSTVVHIDYENSLLTLYDPSGAKIDSSLRPIPINLDIGLPILETLVNINGQEEIPVKLAIDLGHRNSLFLRVDENKKIQAPPLTINTMAGRGIQGEIPSKVGRLQEIKLGSYSIKNVPISFLEPGSNAGLGKNLMDGALGQLILNRFNIILDYQHKQIFLSPNKDMDKPCEYDMAGLVLEQNRDELYFVRFVIENSPAGENGIEKGDKILFLDGKDVRNIPYREIFDCLRQEGREVKMVIERKNKRFEKILKLRRLI